MAKRGNDVLVVSPMYRETLKKIKDMELEKISTSPISFTFDGAEETINVSLYRLSKEDPVFYAFIEHEDFLHSARGYDDGNVKRFALFNKAFAKASVASGFSHPDIIHVHDWHMGYIPLLLKEKIDLPKVKDVQGNEQDFGAQAKTVFTIHNAGHDGKADIRSVLKWMNLPEKLAATPFNCNGYANALTAGAGFADHVTTVSPSHATELRNRWSASDNSVGTLYPIKGIVNGITDEWDPASAKNTFHPRFDANNLDGKRETKRQLCEEFGMDPNRPLMGLVSRLTSEQKGIDVFIKSVDRLVEQGWNIVVAGMGDPELEYELQNAEAKHPKNVKFLRGYSEQARTHKIIAGSDAFAIPSRYEPCGITQLQSMAVGTLPIATKTGGLRDTIKQHETGFLFDPVMTSKGPSVRSEDFVAAAKRAIDTYTNHPDEWHKMKVQAMRQDFSWTASAEKYDQLYGASLAKARDAQKDANRPASSWGERFLAHKRKNYPNKHHVRGLACYNLYPRNYTSLSHMAEDIPRIAGLGFNAVWINPLCEVGNVAQPDWEAFNRNQARAHGKAPLPDPKKDSKKTRSLYATYDAFEINPEFADDKNNPTNNENNLSSLKKLTKTIAAKGMIPMCDIAFSHMSLDSPMVKDGILTLSGGKKVNSYSWFKRYKNGAMANQPMRQGVDSNGLIEQDQENPGEPNRKMVWADIALFDYDNPKVRQEIIDEFWKPYMDFLIDQGFEGIRVDSVAQNHPDVLDEVLGYFKQKLSEKTNKRILPQDVVILGETLGQNIENYAEKTNEITHSYSSTYWMPTNGIESDGSVLPRSGRVPCQKFWEEHRLLNHNPATDEMGNLHMNLNTEPSPSGLRTNRKSLVGGPVGNAGSVDEPNIVDHFVMEPDKYTVSRSEFEAPGNHKAFLDFEKGQVLLPGNPPRVVTNDHPLNHFNCDAAETALREKMAQSMLLAPGGHFLFGGDEFMQVGPRSVFAEHCKAQKIPGVDLSDYVRDINRIVRRLSAPHLGYWAVRQSVDRDDNLVVIERHQTEGYKGVTDVILMSTEPGTVKKKVLDEAELEKIASEISVEKKKKLGETFPTHPTVMELAKAIYLMKNADESHEPDRFRVHCDSRIELSRALEQKVRRELSIDQTRQVA